MQTTLRSVIVLAVCNLVSSVAVYSLQDPPPRTAVDRGAAEEAEALGSVEVEVLGEESVEEPVEQETTTSERIVGSDLGVSLNVLDRAGDGKGARYFEGASFYYSLSKLFGDDRSHFIINLSALDFYEDVEFETGIGLGLLYRVNEENLEEGSFTLSVAYGYNLMADDDEDGEYVMVGFGWSFGRQPKN